MTDYKKQIGSLITGQMLSLILGFVLPLILVRVLTKNDYGLYAQFNVILSFCTVFFSFGLSSELYYSYPLASKRERRILVFQSLMMLFVAGILACLILYIPVVKDYFITDDSFVSCYVYLAISVLMSVPEILITALYVLNNDNRTSATFLPLMTVLRVLLIIILYWCYPRIETVFLAIIISSAIKLVYVVWYARNVMYKNGKGELFDIQILKSQLRYSIPLGFASSVRILVQQLDKLIILSFVSPAVYAVYSIAFYGVPGLTQVYLSISQVYIPRMSVAYKGQNLTGLIELYRSMVSKTLSYTIPIIFIIILFADPIVPFVFSDKYVESIPYFQIYLLTFIVSSIGCGNILRATGETRRSLMAYVYTAVIMMPFTYCAIKFYYLNGAIISATLGAILPKLLLSVYDARSIKKSVLSIYPWKNIFKIVLISLLTLMPFVIIYVYVGHDNFWLSLVWIFCYLLLTFALQLRYSVFVVTLADLISYKNKILKR